MVVTKEFDQTTKYNKKYDVYREIIQEYPLLTKEQESKMAQEKNYQGLVLHNVRLALSLSVKHYNTFMEKEDITSYAILLLCQAAKNYDLTKGSRFTTFAYKTIKFGLINEILMESVQVMPFSTEDMEIYKKALEIFERRNTRCREYERRKKNEKAS